VTSWNWSPFFNAVNGAIKENGQRNQYNSLLDSMQSMGSGAPQQTALPASSGPSIPSMTTSGGASIGGGQMQVNPGSVTSGVATQTPQDAQQEKILQLLRGMDPAQGTQIALPLLLKSMFKDHEYDSGIQYDQQGRAFRTSKDDTTPHYIVGVSKAPEKRIVNGQVIDLTPKPPPTFARQRQLTRMPPFN
jgi:hypothetical protein